MKLIFNTIGGHEIERNPVSCQNLPKECYHEEKTILKLKSCFDNITFVHFATVMTDPMYSRQRAGGSEFEIWTFNCTNTRKSAKLTSVNQMEESYIGIRLRCFYCQIVSFVNHPVHSYCSLFTQHMYIYSLVIGPIFRLYVSFLSLKICDYCLLMFLIVHVYDVSFNVLHYMSPT